MKEKTRRRLLFLYSLTLFAALVCRVVYEVLDVGHHASWAMPWAMKYRMIYNFIVRSWACATMGAIPALYIETGHLRRLTIPIRLLLLLLCSLPVVVILILYPPLWLSGILTGEIASRLWMLTYYVAAAPVLAVLLGFFGGFGLRLWLDRKGDGVC